MRYPELKEKKLAEFTGIMLGDGSIGEYECKKGDGTTNTQRSVVVTLSSEEEEFSKYVISLLRTYLILILQLEKRIMKTLLKYAALDKTYSSF